MNFYVKIFKMKKKVHVYISGRVQGVFFRAFTQERAEFYGITGWVKNLPDGRVEAVAEGDEEVLKEWIKDLWKGPPAARVDNVEEIWEEHKGEFKRFEIRYW
jgi:acylphosphatase